MAHSLAAMSDSPIWELTLRLLGACGLIGGIWGAIYYTSLSQRFPDSERARFVALH